MTRKLAAWDLDVRVVDSVTGEALSGQIVEAWDKDYKKNKNGNDLLWVSTADNNGKCGGSFNKERFQDPSKGHIDRSRPDVYFVVKDAVGNILLETEVKTNIKAGFYSYVLNVDSRVKSLLSPQKAAKNHWIVLGNLDQINKGQRYTVECYDKDTYNQHGNDDWVFTVSTDKKGKFEHSFYEWDFRYKIGEKEKEPDLYFKVKDLDGNILFISDVYQNLPTNNVYYFNVDLKTLSTGMASVPIASTRVTWSTRAKNPKITRFPVAYNSFAKFRIRPNFRIFTPRLARITFINNVFRYPFLSYTRKPIKNSWEFEVNIENRKTGKPLIGARVEAWDKDFSKQKSDNDLLWIDTTDRNGRCVGFCTNNDFQDLSIRHKDKGKPDVYFLVKDRKGNFLHCSEVYANLDAGVHQYTLQVSPTPKRVKPIQSKTVPFWNIQGDVLAVQGTGPFVLECYDKDYSKKYGPEDLLFKETLSENGRFDNTIFKRRFSYKKHEKEREPDVFFVVKDLKDQVIYTTEVFSNLKQSSSGEAYEFSIGVAALQTRMRTVSAPVGSGGSGTGPTTGTGPAVNRLPSIQIGQPSGTLILGESVRIDYMAFDPESDAIHIEAAYSIDGGTTYLPATESSHPASEGTSNLVASSIGSSHAFIWQAIDDLPALPTPDVIFRIQPFDPQAGGSASTQPFTVGSIPVTTNPVDLKILSPRVNTTQAAVVEIKYQIRDDLSKTSRVVANYSTDGGLTYKTASIAFGFGSEELLNVSTNPTGKTHSFFWNSEGDSFGLPANTAIHFQIELIAPSTGVMDTTGPFFLDFSNLPPMIDIYAPSLGSRHGSPVAVEYVLTDRDSHIVRLEAFFSIDNGETFLPANSASGGDGLAAIQSSDFGAVKTFMWDAARDLRGGMQDNVIIKIQAFDAHAGGIDFSDVFDVTLPVQPSVRLVTPNASSWGTPLPINFILSHPSGNQLLDIEIEYSLDNGQTYLAVTEATNLTSEGLTGLTSNIAGLRHFFTWDAQQDIPTLTTDIQKDVLLRIRAFKGTEMGETISPPFNLDAGFVGIAPDPNPGVVSTERASLYVFDPVSYTGIHVPVRFLVKHPDNRRVNVRVEFSANGAEYESATPAKNSDQTTNLAAPNINADYRYIWDAQQDLDKMGLQSATVTMRLTPYTGSQDGVEVETKPFSIAIEKTKMPAKVPHKAQYDNVSLQIIEGDGQEVIPGLLARENLTVELTDANGRSVRGARITFSTDVSSQVPITFEDHPFFRTSTNYYGRAGIRVRPELGREGRIKIHAHVVGMPGVSASFSLVSRVPGLVPASSNPTGPFEYGKAYRFFFYFDSGVDYDKTDFLSDSYDPVEFKVTTHNAEAVENIIRLPGRSGFNNGIFVDLTPSYLGGTSQAPTTEFFDLKVEVLNMPGIMAYEKRFSVQTENNAQHLQIIRVLDNGFGSADFVYQDKRLSLEVISGHDPADPDKKLPQVGYPDLTLATPFQVKVVDERGEEYTESTGFAGTTTVSGGCDLITVNKKTLQIEWRARGGMISTAAGKGTKSVLKLDYNKKVYFTPTQAGSWSLTAEVIDYVFDKESQKKAYSIKRRTGSSSNSTIVRDYFCGAHSGFFASLSRIFYIHGPELYGFEDIEKATATKPGPLMKQIKPGMKSRIIVKGVSLYLSSSRAKEVELQNVMADGKDVKKYAGTNLKFTQKIPLAKDQNDSSILRSGEILFLQNDVKTSSGIAMACLPLSRVTAEAAGIKFAIKAAGLKRSRLRFGPASTDGDTEYAYESPTGTTPHGGAQGSVNLHNGELVIGNCDLSFPSREGQVQLCRTYRSQVKSLLDTDNETEAVEPLGPGWFLDAGMHLEVLHEHLRFWDGSGAYYDYLSDYSGKGQFLFIIRNDVISPTQSAYEVRDRHRNYIHFNIDGTLRFIVDRFGNKFSYQYNEKAQLIKVKDCLLPDTRQFIIKYHESTKTNKKNKWVDKIKEVIDFDKRKITYEYYAENGLRNGAQTGGPGLLMKVRFPECKTVFAGSTAAVKHRSYEAFEYEIDSRLGWRLKKVFGEDSKGAEQRLFTNHYDSNGRIIRQEEAESEYKITLVATGKIDYQDKNDNVMKFEFPNSPYWNHTAPNKITDPETNITVLRHNTHGHLVYIKPPRGGTVDYIYDEDSPYSRARSNMLAVITTSDQGDERITTHTYTGRDHLLMTTVGPAGNSDGVDPQLHLHANNFDHQRSATGEGLGNIVDSFSPRALHVVYKPLANGRRQVEWIEDEPLQEYTFNSFGQMTSHIDERGVKTVYRYFAAGSPTEGSVGTVGGGFLAQVKHDTEVSTKRNRHLPGTDALPQLTFTNYTYNSLGFVTGTTDEKGISTVYTLNKLGDIIAEQHGMGVKGLNLSSETHIGPNGEVIRTITNQPGSGTNAVEAENNYDTYGRLIKQISKVNGANEQTVTNSFDKGDRVVTTRDSLSDVETTQVFDKRNLVTESIVTSGSKTYTTTNEYNENGTLTGVTAPTGDKTSFEQNDFDETIKTTDEATGISSESILNDAGIAVVQISREAGGSVATCEETVFDEQYRVRRVHTLRFQKGSGAAIAGGASKIPENLGINGDYLSSLSGFIPDAGIAPNDGRTTVEISYGIGGDEAQRKDNELGQYMSRTDAAGRPLETDNRHGLQANTVYNDQANTAETSFTAKADNPAFGETPYTYTVISEFNDAGVPISVSDEQNRRSQFESDEGGSITSLINPENSKTTFKIDELNNMEEAGMIVAVSGTHNDQNELKESIARFNTAMSIKARSTFDNLGRLQSVTDNANNTYQCVYKDNLLDKIVLPGSHGQQRFTYDDAGRIKTISESGGQTTTYGYADGRLVTVQTGQNVTSIQYDGSGNISQIGDASGSVQYEYDSLGNLIRETGSSTGQSTEYNYDGTGRMIKQILSANEFIEYVYDNKSGKLKEVKDQDGSISSYSYFGHAIKQESTNGINTVYAYEKGQVSESRISGALSGDILSTFKRDLMDRVIEETETFDGKQSIRKYAYDTVGRVLREELTLPGVPQPLTIRYYYDGDGIVLREERDEFNVATGEIERVIIERKRDELGMITSHEEISRSIIPSGLPPTGSGPAGGIT